MTLRDEILEQPAVLDRSFTEAPTVARAVVGISRSGASPDLVAVAAVVPCRRDRAR
jgi:fructoselysine-6-P-deglycase FrlB-like protein